MNAMVYQAQELLSGSAATYAIVAVVALILLVVLWKILAGRKPAPAPLPDLRIDLASLGTHGPPAKGAALEYQGVPVRLAAIVLAPAGRVRELPPLNALDEVFDAILPGLAAVVAAHRPLVRKWPPQLSQRGFTHQFFSQAKLPGDAGRGTPWCSVAGVFKAQGQSAMAGLVLRCEKANTYGQEVVDREGMWPQTLRVKGA